MAECKQERETHKFVVLSIKEGAAFGYLRNKVLRILAVFENKPLSSQLIHITPTPIFKINFTWRVENSLLKILQSTHSSITIEFKLIQKGREEQSIGFSIIKLRQAQYISSVCDSPCYRCLELKGVKRPIGIKNPYIFVSLTIQTIKQLVVAEQCFSTDVEINKSRTNIKKALGKNVGNKSVLEIKSEPLEQTESCDQTRTAASSSDIIATSQLYFYTSSQASDKQSDTIPTSQIYTDINSQTSGKQGRSDIKSQTSGKQSDTDATSEIHTDMSLQISDKQGRSDIKSQTLGKQSDTDATSEIYTEMSSQISNKQGRSVIKSQTSGRQSDTNATSEIYTDMNSQISDKQGRSVMKSQTSGRQSNTDATSHQIYTDINSQISDKQGRSDIKSQTSGRQSNTDATSHQIYTDINSQISDKQGRSDIKSQTSGRQSNTDATSQIYSEIKSQTLGKQSDTIAKSQVYSDINSTASGKQSVSTSKTSSINESAPITIRTKSSHGKSTRKAPSRDKMSSSSTQISKVPTLSTSYYISEDKTTTVDENWTDRTTATSSVLTSYTKESKDSAELKSELRSGGRSHRKLIIKDDPQNKNDDNNNLQPKPPEKPVNINLPPKPPEEPVIQKPLWHDKEDEPPTAPTYVLKEPKDSPPKTHHIFKVKMQFKSAEWFMEVTDIKVSIKFYNPHCDNIVSVKQGDYYIPNLQISNVICCMYYVSTPEEFLKMFIRQPPQIKFYRNTNELVARGSLKMACSRFQPRSKPLKTYIPITEKNNEIIAHINVLLWFEDLGLVSTDTTEKCLRSAITYKEQPPSEQERVSNISVEGLVSDLENLAAIHEQLRQTYNKIETCFHKMLQAQGLEHILEQEQPALNKEIEQSKEKATATSKNKGNIHNAKSSQNEKATSTAGVIPCQVKTKENVPNEKIAKTFMEHEHPVLTKKTKQSKEKAATSTVDAVPCQAKTEENVTTENIAKTFTEYKSNQNENIVWCEFCKQYHAVRKTNDYITSIEPTDSPKLKSKERKQEVKFVNKDKQSIAPHIQQEKSSEQQIQDIKENKQGKCSLKAVGVQTNKPTIQSRPRQMAYIPKPAITVITYPCQGCEQYLEVGYGKRVWQDDELKFWCKDCCIRKLQSEVKETMQNCTSEISALKDQIKTLEEDIANYAKHSVSKEKYDFLSAAQHNLTMLFIHAKHQNEYLHEQCSKTAEKLEELKKIIPQKTPLFKITQNENQFYRDKEQMNEIYERVRELKQEIDDYRYKDDTPKQMDEAAAIVFTRTIKKGGQKSSRRERCEACQILDNRAKIAEMEKNKANQPSVPQQIKCVKKDTPRKRDEQSKETASAAASNFREYEIRQRLASVRVNLLHYLDERDKLVDRYTCNAVVSHMNEVINKLWMEWNELRTELEKINR